MTDVIIVNHRERKLLHKRARIIHRIRGGKVRVKMLEGTREIPAGSQFTINQEQFSWDV